jgi:hypothetical protein
MGVRFDPVKMAFVNDSVVRGKGKVRLIDDPDRGSRKRPKRDWAEDGYDRERPVSSDGGVTSARILLTRKPDDRTVYQHRGRSPHLADKTVHALLSDVGLTRDAYHFTPEYHGHGYGSSFSIEAPESSVPGQGGAAALVDDLHASLLRAGYGHEAHLPAVSPTGDPSGGADLWHVNYYENGKHGIAIEHHPLRGDVLYGHAYNARKNPIRSML